MRLQKILGALLMVLLSPAIARTVHSRICTDITLEDATHLSKALVLRSHTFP